MARIKDLWYNARVDPGTGERRPTARHGKGKRWLLEYRDPAGAIRTEAFAKKPDAERRKVDVEADVQRGEYLDPKQAAIRFRVVAERFRDGRHGLARRTLRLENAIIDKQIQHFGEYEIGALAKLPSVIRAYFAGRRTRSGSALAPATLRTEMRLLSAIMDTALDDEMIRRNPMAKIERPKRRPVKVEPWPLDVIQALVDHHRELTWTIPALAFGAGLRQGEAFGVSPDDINFLRRELTVQRQVLRDNGRLYFAPPKWGSLGTVDLDPELVDRLAAHLAANPPIEVTLPWTGAGAKPGETRTVRLLSTTRFGNAWEDREYNRVHWHPALRAADMEPAGSPTGLHQLRHAFASYRLAEGMPVTDVQHQLRHATLEETVRTYAHRVPKRAAERLDGAVASVFCSAPVPSRSVSATSGNARR